MKRPFPSSCRASQAFTLIELLIVVAIIAILAAIAVPNFLEAQIRAKIARAQTDMRTIATGMESYIIDYNHYPTFAVPVFVGEAAIYRLTTPVAYLTSIPADPFQFSKPAKSPQASKNYVPTWGPAYRYFAYEPGNTTTPWATLGWSVRSMGPDQDWDLVGYAQDNDNAIPQNGYYDATNGTISNGDVIRLGGAKMAVGTLN